MLLCMRPCLIFLSFFLSFLLFINLFVYLNVSSILSFFITFFAFPQSFSIFPFISEAYSERAGPPRRGALGCFPLSHRVSWPMEPPTAQKQCWTERASDLTTKRTEDEQTDWSIDKWKPGYRVKDRPTDRPTEGLMKRRTFPLTVMSGRIQKGQRAWDYARPRGWLILIRPITTLNDKLNIRDQGRMAAFCLGASNCHLQSDNKMSPTHF